MIRKLPYEAIKSARPTAEELKRRVRYPVSVVLENIRSLHNVGSIFRTSDGASIERLYITGYTGYPPRKEIDKTALGSVDTVEWVRMESAAAAIGDLKSRGYCIAALEHTDSSVPYTEARYHSPLCLVVGNEVDGITEGTVALCDMAVEIPMGGIKQSLNVSVAYGIVIYHIINEMRKGG